MWRKFLPDAAKDHTAAMKKHEVVMKKHNTEASKHAASVHDLEAALETADGSDKTKLAKKLKTLQARAPRAPTAPLPRMQEKERRLILNLATGLKLLLAGSSRTSEGARGAELLSRYLLGYKEVRHS